MKKIDESSIILRFSDNEKTIYDIGLDSILNGGLPIDYETGNDMEYLGVYLLPDNVNPMDDTNVSAIQVRTSKYRD